MSAPRKRTHRSAVYLTALERDLVAEALWALRSDLQLMKSFGCSEVSTAVAKSHAVKRLDETRKLFLDKDLTTQAPKASA